MKLLYEACSTPRSSGEKVLMLPAVSMLTIASGSTCSLRRAATSGSAIIAHVWVSSRTASVSGGQAFTRAIRRRIKRA